MRLPLIAANWKMNTTVAEAKKLVGELLEDLDRVEGIEKVLCPPFVSLAIIKEMLRHSSIKLGAQNMHFEIQGAYTGEISPLMVRELCDYVILGHSERRLYFHETDQIVNKKLKAALANGIKPILCVGETTEENEVGKTEEVIHRQVRMALDGVETAILENAASLVIAYEPVWAIGTGKAASGKQAADTAELIRAVIAGLWNTSIARNLRILYGGSVTGTNISEFVGYPEIDGALVGGASLRAREFLSIVQQTAEIKRTARYR